MLDQLIEWQRQHGYDVAGLFEDRPDLFRDLIENPSGYLDSDVGREFARLASKIAEAAKAKSEYREVFSRDLVARNTKEQLSIGIVDVTDDEEI